MKASFTESCTREEYFSSDDPQNEALSLMLLAGAVAAQGWRQLPQHCAVVCSIDLLAVIHSL